MARLTDADALIQNHGNDVTNWDNPYAVKISSIEHAPTVDAVEVTHCKNCKHWLKDVQGCTDTIGRCRFANYMVGGNAYCVYGERKEG